MENGKDYVSPSLRKRADKSPAYFFHCMKCEAEADGYTLSDIDNPPHCMALNVYCHGDSMHIGIEDVSGFREMMARHQYVEGAAHPSPFSVFMRPISANAAPIKDPHGNMELHDGPK